MNEKELMQLRAKLYHASRLALEVELAAGKEWGERCSIATYAGRGVAKLDQAIYEVDTEIDEAQ